MTQKVCAEVCAGERNEMAVCDTCGNDYDKTFTVTRGSNTWTFDCFECAVQTVAPVCEHCGCRILGHGIEAGQSIYCCAHCSRQEAATGAEDRV